jgi:hypothetical protein
LGQFIQREDIQLSFGEQVAEFRQLADPLLVGHYRDAVDLPREGYAKPDVGPQGVRPFSHQIILEASKVEQAKGCSLILPVRRG